MNPAPTPQLILRPISPSESGEPIEPLRLDGQLRSVVVGRTSQAGWTIPDPAVSRRHATLSLAGRDWMLSDLESRHGTWLNGQRLGSGESLPLRRGDEVRFGRWVCRCEAPGAATTRLTTLAEPQPSHASVQTIPRTDLSGVAQRKLEAIIDFSRGLEGSADRARVAELLVQCTASGSGCPRVLLLRPAGGDALEVLASTESAATHSLSRTLIAAAGQGELVQLSDPRADLDARSLIDLNIRSAICAPLMVGGVAEWFLYLDTRAGEGGLPADAAAFCSAVAQLGSLALERLAAAEVTARREQLERDMASAHRAQQLLMPARSGACRALSYCFESIPGRLVAGDLFDVVALPDGRTAFFLGDVCGKGLAAALLMASAQTRLRTLLERSAPLAEAVTALNEHVHGRSDDGTFLTLIAGIFDPARRVFELADAGHGLCCMCSGADPRRLRLKGGLPLGVDAGTRYGVEVLDAAPGDRLVLFSDGLVEQPDNEGRQLGFDAALGVLAVSADPAQDVEGLVRAVREHAGGSLADDLTVVSLAVGEEA